MTLPCLSKNFHEFGNEDELFFTTPEAESEVMKHNYWVPPPPTFSEKRNIAADQESQGTRRSSDREQSPINEPGENIAENSDNEVNPPSPSDSSMPAEHEVSADINMPRRSTRQNMFRGIMSDGTNRRGRNWFRGRNNDFHS